MPRTGLDEFRDAITDYKTTISWVVKGAVAAPLADYVLHIGAPWPDGVPIMASVTELIILISLFHFWRGKSQKVLTRLMVVALIVLVISFAGYLYLFGSYTFVKPGKSQRYVKGFVVRPEIQQTIPQRIQSVDAALRGAEYEEGSIFTESSLTAARLVLLATWLILFASLSAFIGTFVLAQRKRRVRQAAGP
jgi:hypothetical protein